ncbi:MAG: hypothetical protein WD512_00840, partial [Candidatus Paceibacterota bacterium]
MHIISLGSNCSIQMAITMNFSGPVSVFSWCKSFNIESVISEIDTDYAGLLDIKNFKGNTYKNIIHYPHEPSL